jgi:hypothetical protein
MLFLWPSEWETYSANSLGLRYCSCIKGPEQPFLSPYQNHFWVTIKYHCDYFWPLYLKKTNNFSRTVGSIEWGGKNKTRCYLQRGLECFLTGLLTTLLPGDVTRQAKTPSHQNRQTCRRYFQTGLTLKRTFTILVLLQPQCGNIQ